MWIVTLSKLHLLHKGQILIFDHAGLFYGKLSVISRVILSPANALFEWTSLAFWSGKSCPLNHAIVISHIFEQSINEGVKFIFSLILVKLLFDIHFGSTILDEHWK